MKTPAFQLIAPALLAVIAIELGFIAAKMPRPISTVADYRAATSIKEEDERLARLKIVRENSVLVDAITDLSVRVEGRVNTVAW